MGRPHNADGHRTRQALLDAALLLFAENGYFGTTLRDIAASIGIRESAVYNYFPGKEALFEALIASDQQSKVEYLAAAIDDPITDAREALTGVAVFALDHFSTPRQQQLFRILMSDGFRLAKEGRIDLIPRLSIVHTHLRALMRRLVSGGWLQNASPRFLAMEFMGPLLLWRHMHAIGSRLPAIRNRRSFARQHVDQFLRGAGLDVGDRALRGRAEEGRRARRPGASCGRTPGTGPHEKGRVAKRQKRRHEGADL
jgi:AcrR family transcriptional regulator